MCTHIVFRVHILHTHVYIYTYTHKYWLCWWGMYAASTLNMAPIHSHTIRTLMLPSSELTVRYGSHGPLIGDLPSKIYWNDDFRVRFLYVYQRQNLHFPMVFPWFSHRTICHVWPDTVCKGDARAFALETEVPISVCLGIASVRELRRTIQDWFITISWFITPSKYNYKYHTLLLWHSYKMLWTNLANYNYGCPWPHPVAFLTINLHN